MMCKMFSRSTSSFRKVLFFIGIICLERIVSISAAPSSFTSKQRRESAKTLQESNVAQVDADDGEVWYPTIEADEDENRAKKNQVSQKEEMKSETEDDEQSSDSNSEPDYYSNGDQEKEYNDNDWIHAIKALFSKFGYRDDQIPEPFGSKKSQNVDMPSHEFGLILQSLVSKTPKKLHDQLEEIIQSSGISDENVKSQDNMSMLKKIGKTVKQIQGDLQHVNSPPSHKSHTDEDSQISSGSSSNNHQSGEDTDTESSEDIKQDEETLEKDFGEIKTIIEEVKSAIESSGVKNVEKTEEKLEKISSILEEVEEIAENDISILESSPCIHEKYSHSSSNEHLASKDESKNSNEIEESESESGEDYGAEETEENNQNQAEQNDVLGQQEQTESPKLDVDSDAAEIASKLKEIAERERIRHDNHETGERDEKEQNDITDVLQKIHDLGVKEKERELKREEDELKNNKVHASDVFHTHPHPKPESHEHRQSQSHVSHNQHETHSFETTKKETHKEVPKTIQKEENGGMLQAALSSEDEDENEVDEATQNSKSEGALTEVKKIVQEEIEVSHKLNDEHEKHKQEMLEVIRHLKLTDTSEGDQQRIRKIEDIIEKIDQEHYKEMDLEDKLEALASNDDGEVHSSKQSHENHQHTGESHENHNHAGESHENHQHTGERHENHNHAGESHENHQHTEESHENHNHAGESHEHHQHTEESHENHNHAGESHENHNHAGESHENHHHAGASNENHNHAGENHDNHHHVEGNMEKHNHAEKSSISHVDLQKDHNDKFGLDKLKMKVGDNDDFLNNVIKPHILEKDHENREHEENGESSSAEDLENSIEYIEKVHHVKKGRKGSKHHKNLMQDSRQTKFRDDSLRPYVQHVMATEKATLPPPPPPPPPPTNYDYSENVQEQQQQTQEENVSNNQENSNDDNYYSVDLSKLQMEEEHTQPPFVPASVNFQHVISELVPIPKSAVQNENYESQNSQQSSMSMHYDTNTGNQAVSSNSNNYNSGEYSGENHNQPSVSLHYDTNSGYQNTNNYNSGDQQVAADVYNSNSAGDYSSNNEDQETKSSEYADENFSGSDNSIDENQESESSSGLTFENDVLQSENENQQVSQTKYTESTGNSENANMEPEMEDVQTAIVNLDGILQGLDSPEHEESRVKDILDHGPKFSQNSHPDAGRHNSDNNHKDLSPAFLENVIKSQRLSRNARSHGKPGQIKKKYHHVSEHGDAVPRARMQRRAIGNRKNKSKRQTKKVIRSKTARKN